MSTPAVAGVVAMLIQDWRTEGHGGANDRPLPALVKAWLIHGARDQGEDGPDFIYGYGSVDAQKSIDILRAGNGSFLAGSAAIKGSFEDLKKHLLCLVAGSRAAVAATLDEVGPTRIEEGLKGQAMLFQTKVDACWREFVKRHAQISSDARENADSAINRAFKAGYERQVRKLDELGTQA
jgi:hypothetical protein